MGWLASLGGEEAGKDVGRGRARLGVPKRVKAAVV